MKIAFIIPFLRQSSGWRTACIGAIRALSVHEKVAPVLIVQSKDRAAAASLFSDFPLYTLPETQFMAASAPRTWGKLVRTWLACQRINLPTIDLIHSLAAYPTGLVGHWLAKRVRAPHIITIHGTYGVKWRQSWSDNVLYSHVLHNVDHICTVSQGTADIFMKYYGAEVDSSQLTTVHWGTDFQKQATSTVACSAAQVKGPILMSVGEVKIRKGHHTSIRAFAKVKRQIPNAQYHIVGKIEPGYRQQLDAIIKAENIKDVVFLGRISSEKLQELYQKASLFVLTPQRNDFNFEGFGLVYIEAGTYGLPVIGTRTGGVANAIHDGETGFLAEPDDVNIIAEAICQLLTDDELRERMGRANRAWAETLTWERYADEQYQIYQDVLGSG